MPNCNNLIQAHYSDQDDLDSALTQGGLALDVLSNAATPLNVEIEFRYTPCARVLSVSGEPVRVARGSRQVSRDDGGFLGVLFQRMDHTLCSQRGQQQVITPGEITVWHGRQSLDFRMPDRFRKLCLLVPIERFEGLLPDPDSMSALISKQAQICLSYLVPVLALLPITCSRAMKNLATTLWR